MNKVLLALTLIMPVFLNAQADSVRPVISGIYVNPNPVSPNSDGNSDTAYIGFTLFRPAFVVLEVSGTNPSYPVSGYRLIDSTLIDAGHFEYAWDGKINGQVYNATFNFLIFAVDTEGFVSDSIIFPVVVDTTLPLITYTEVSPNPFSPNNDGVEDYANFIFTVDNTHPDQYDYLMLPHNRIATLTITPGSYQLEQNGQVIAVNGNLITTPDFPPFPVYFAVKVDHMTVESFTIGFKDWGNRTVTVSLQSRPIELIRVGDLTNKMDVASLISVWPDDSLQDPNDVVQVGIYAFTGNASLSIYDENGDLVHNVNFWPSFRGDGSYLTQWGPGPIPDGRYTYDIQVEDEAGNVKHIGGELIANSVPTTVGNIQVVPPKISPENQDGISDVAEIRFTISENANVTVKLYNSTTRYDSTTYVTTLMDNQPLTGGSHSLRFNGRLGGNFLASKTDSTYGIVITATDPYTGDADQGVAEIEIDNQGPAFVFLDTLAIPEITSSSEDTVVGYTEPHSLVRIFKNGLFATELLSDSISGRFEAPIHFQIGDTLIFAIAFDDVMNEGDTSNILRVVYDPDPPVILQTIPEDHGFYNTAIETVRAVVMDNISGVNPDTFVLSVLKDGTSLPSDTMFSAGDTFYSVLSSPILPGAGMDGHYRIFATFYDSAWNELRDTFEFIFDSESPFPSINPPDSSKVNRLDTVYVTVSDSLSGVFPDSTSVVLTGPAGNVNTSITFTSDTSFVFYPTPPLRRDGTEDGEYTIILRIFDRAMNYRTDTFTIFYDTQPPVVDSSFPSQGQILGTAYLDTITVVFKDDIAGVNLNTARATLFRDTTFIPGSYIYRFPDTLLFVPENTWLNDGVYHFIFHVSDSAENTFTDTLNFQIDTTPPEFLFTYPSADTCVGDSIDTLMVVVSDGPGCGVFHVNLSLTAPDGSLLEGNPVFSNDTLLFLLNSPLVPNGAMDGLYTMVLHASDFIGNETVDTVNFIYDNIAPSIILTEPDSGDTGVVLRDSVYAVITDLRAGVDTSAGIDFSRTHIFLLYPDSTSVPGRRSVHDNGDGTYSLSWVISRNARIVSGTYTMLIEIFDRALNSRFDTLTFEVAALEPVVMAVYPINGAYLNSIDSVYALIHDRTGSGIDTTTSITVRNPHGNLIAGRKYFSGSDTLSYVIFRFSAPLSDNGQYNVEIRPVSRNGIHGETVSTYFYFDNQPPEVIERFPTGGIYEQVSTVWIRVSDLSPISSFTMTVVHGGDTINGSSGLYGDTLIFTPLEPINQTGDYTVLSSVTDLAGNTLNDTFSFSVNRPLTFRSVPSDGDTFRSPLTRVYAYVNVLNGTITDWSMDLLTDGGDTVAGTATRLDDSTFFYDLQNPLSCDGSDNGFYTIEFRVTLDSTRLFSFLPRFYYLCDTVAPSAPVLTDSIPSRTTSTRISISGKGEPMATVFVSVNHTLQDSQIVNLDSTFTFSVVTLTFGVTNTIEVFQRDVAGNFGDTLRLNVYCGNPIFEVIPSKPFNDVNRVFTVSLPADATVTLEIYTTEGRKVYSHTQNLSAGNYHRIKWNLRDNRGNTVNNGVYIYIVRARYRDGNEDIKKGLLAVLR